MKINKKLIGSFIIGGLLFTSGGFVLADEVITKEYGVKQQVRQGETINNPACFTLLDQLVTENNLTQEQANRIKQEIEEKRSQHFEERDKARKERRSQGRNSYKAKLMQNPDLIEKLVENGALTPEEAKYISEGLCRRI